MTIVTKPFDPLKYGRLVDERNLDIASQLDACLTQLKELSSRLETRLGQDPDDVYVLYPVDCAIDHLAEAVRYLYGLPSAM